MASSLIVEDGTMIPGANCFASVSDVDAWQGMRGSADWPAPTFAEPEAAPFESEDTEEPEDLNIAAKEAAILKATDYLNGLAWKGRRAKPGRMLVWPRKDVIDSDGYEIASDEIPAAVNEASCYLAGLIYAGRDMQPFLTRGGQIQTKTLGKMSTTYFPNASVRNIASGLADILRGLVNELDNYAGTGVGLNGPRTSIVTLVQG